MDGFSARGPGHFPERFGQSVVALALLVFMPHEVVLQSLTSTDLELRGRLASLTTQ